MRVTDEMGGPTEAIIPSFVDSLDEDILDAIIDSGEAGVDSILDMGVFTAVPVVRTVIGMGKTLHNLRERNFAQQAVHFLAGLRDGTIDAETLDAHRARLKNDSKYAEKVLGYVLILIDKNVDVTRSKLQGRLYGAFVMGRICWSDFVDSCEVLSRCMVSDLNILKTIWNGELKASTDVDTYRIERLVSVGLVKRSMKAIVSVGNTTDMRYYLSVTQFGEMLCSNALADSD